MEILRVFKKEIGVIKVRSEQVFKYCKMYIVGFLGYGHIAPKTTWGRLLTIVYAIIGIPLTFLYLSNIGNFLANLFRLFYKKICCDVCCCKTCDRKKKLKLLLHRKRQLLSFAENKFKQEVDSKLCSDSQNRDHSEPYGEDYAARVLGPFKAVQQNTDLDQSSVAEILAVNVDGVQDVIYQADENSNLRNENKNGNNSDKESDNLRSVTFSMRGDSDIAENDRQSDLGLPNDVFETKQSEYYGCIVNLKETEILSDDVTDDIYDTLEENDPYRLRLKQFLEILKSNVNITNVTAVDFLDKSKETDILQDSTDDLVESRRHRSCTPVASFASQVTAEEGDISSNIDNSCSSLEYQGPTRDTKPHPDLSSDNTSLTANISENESASETLPSNHIEQSIHKSTKIAVDYNLIKKETQIESQSSVREGIEEVQPEKTSGHNSMMRKFAKSFKRSGRRNSPKIANTACEPEDCKPVKKYSLEVPPVQHRLKRTNTLPAGLNRKPKALSRSMTVKRIKHCNRQRLVLTGLNLDELDMLSIDRRDPHSVSKNMQEYVRMMSPGEKKHVTLVRRKSFVDEYGSMPKQNHSLQTPARASVRSRSPQTDFTRNHVIDRRQRFEGNVDNTDELELSEEIYTRRHDRISTASCSSAESGRGVSRNSSELKSKKGNVFQRIPNGSTCGYGDQNVDNLDIQTNMWHAHTPTSSRSFKYGDINEYTSVDVHSLEVDGHTIPYYDKLDTNCDENLTFIDEPFNYDYDIVGQDDEDDEKHVTVPISICLVIIAGYIFAGAVLFTLWEDWDLITGSYFCFITLSTIGFGDIVPGTDTNEWDSHEKLVLCALWLAFGLSLLAMCFNLMQEEVKEKFRRLGRKLGLLKNEDE